jgi:uncharacterized membrane protein
MRPIFGAMAGLEYRNNTFKINANKNNHKMLLQKLLQLMFMTPQYYAQAI